ncbi:MAG: phosphodiester glycosidase family protein, partial [Clostridia bacterium]|nr:phosphodiester glycosidase family protein [Clostridia bacterium]
MKFTKRLLCFLLTALLVLPVCGGLLSSAAAEYSFTEDSSKAYEVTDGVFYSEYTLSSGVYENVYVSASALEFNTEDYMVVAFGGAAGGAAYLANQYRLATEAGYEVVGAINGSFFSMDSGSTTHGNYGYLNEYLVSGGEIYSADNGNTASEFGGVVAFMSDGSIANVTDSCLSFGLYINGQSVPGGLAHVNKYGGRYNPANWGNGFYYFDSHSGDLYYDTSKDASGKVYGEMISQALTFDNVPGYQVLCRKVNGSRLSVDSTLRGEVISVSNDAYGTKLAEDEFILFVKADSPNVSYVKGLAAGDPIDITATELGSNASGVTAGADSIIGICGYLVKDGKNLTTSSSFNTGAAHSNTTKARWTAFGIKADGSYVFFTTEGASTGSDGSVTLQDVAKAMMEMGCVDVIRLDGGGSSGMYVCDDGTGKAGFKQYSGRSIADCLLIVKRSSPALQKGKTELQALT